MKKELVKINLKVNLDSRQETMDNQGFTVYPVVMIKEGVHNDILYTLAELTKFHETWNGVPVPIQHPEIDGRPVSANNPQIYTEQVVGTIFNAHMDGDSLKAEVWLNNDKVNSLAPAVRDFLQGDGQMDVSTGLFAEDINQTGNFNGQDYVSIATNIRPDHLALLPGVEGACSWEDGCGIRANKNKGGSMKSARGNKKEGDEFIKDPDQYFVPSDESEIKANAVDYTKTVEALRDAVNAMDVDNQRYYYLSRAYDDYAIYRVNYIGTNQAPAYMRQEYNLVDGKVVWTGEAVEVEKNVSFSPKTVQTFEKKNGKEEKTNNKEENNMSDVKTMKECCKDKVDELIANNSNFTEDNRDDLLGMTEAAFALVINVATPVKKKKEEPKTNEVEEPKTNSEIKLEDLPEDMRQSIEYGKKVMTNKKNELIDQIKANESNKFSDEMLGGYDLDMLETLAGSIPKPKVVSNYGLSNPGNVQVNSNDDMPEPLPATGNDWTEK